MTERKDSPSSRFRTMKIFDFDNTIYDGESCFDFFIFCVKRKKSLCVHLPSVVYNLIRYKMGRVGIEAVYAFCDKMMGVFFENSAHADRLLKEFWSVNRSKLKPEILSLIGSDDAIISAAPRFLLENIADELKAETLICTETKDDHVTFLCYGRNKVRAFCERFEGCEIDEFYTDSVNDAPMMKMAKRAYMVKGTKITPAGQDKI